MPDNPPDTPTELPQEAELLPEGSRADPVLAAFVNLVRAASRAAETIAIGMTLAIDGQLYSGMLVSGHAWAAQVAKDLRRAESEGIAIAGGAFAGLFDEVARMLTPPEGLSPIGHLHLVSAAPVDSQGRRAAGRGIPLRVRLEAVSGWAIGTTSPVSPPAGWGEP